MEKNMGNEMETGIIRLKKSGFRSLGFWDNGKENGNYRNYGGYIWII